MPEKFGPCRKRIPVTVKKTYCQMTLDEEKRFLAAIDLLIGELVQREIARRSALKQLPASQSPQHAKPELQAGLAMRWQALPGDSTRISDSSRTSTRPSSIPENRRSGVPFVCFSIEK